MTKFDPKPLPHAEALLEHAPWLRRVALAITSDVHDAEDVTQETWLAAMEGGPADRDRGRTRSWLRTVARRSASKQRKRTAAEGRREQASARIEAIPSAAELAEQAEMQKRLLDAIGRLDESTRRAILLRYFRGMSAAEIARAERAPSATVRSRLKRGLDRLREELASDARDRQALLGFATAGGMSAAGPEGDAPSESTASTPTSETLAPTLLPIGAGVTLIATILTVAIVLTTRIEPDPVAVETGAVRGAAQIDENPMSNPTQRDNDGSKRDEVLPNATRKIAHTGPVADTSSSVPAVVVIRTVSPDGEPVAGVPIRLVHRSGNATYPGANAITDAAGVALFADLDPGTYVPSIPPDADWFDVANTPWRLHLDTPEPTIEHESSIARSLTLVVQPTATIVVRILDSDGVLLEDTSMRLQYSWARGNGSVGLEAKRVDDHLVLCGIGVFDALSTTFVARHPGFEDAIERQVVLEPGKTHDLGTLAFERRLASVAGSVSTSDGRPLVSALVLVEVEGQTERTTTKDDGSFALYDLPHGSVTLSLSDYRLRDGALNFTLRAGEHHDVARLVIADPSRILTGRVRVEGGHAFRDATVELGPYRTQAASDGSFSIRGEPLEPATLTVRARVPALGTGNLAAHREAVTFDADTVDLLIRPSGLVLEIRDIETGDPVDFEWFSMTGQRGIDLPADGRFGASFIAGQDDAPGIVRFDDPPAGPWSATITIRNYEPKEVAFEVREDLGDEEQRIVIEMYPITHE